MELLPEVAEKESTFRGLLPSLGRVPGGGSPGLGVVYNCRLTAFAPKSD